MAWISTDAAIPGAGAGFRRALHQTGARLAGPGGYYNVGNAIGLAMGIGLQVGSLPDGGIGVQAALDAMLDYLGGNAGAMALTVATAIFFWSGEAYHRAWANGAPPNEALNRRGDVLSGVGALVLGIALLSLGQVMLAATAGLLHAAGKFGSAYKWRPMPGWPVTWPDLFRTAVLASRVPALLAALIDLMDVVATADGGTPWSAYLTPVTLLVCYALWCKADLMLFCPPAKPVVQA